MHILFVVGKFPELTFILRTVKAVAERGHDVTVAARRRGEWANFRDELPLPSTLSVKYLLPNADLSDLRFTFALVVNLSAAVITSPRAAITLLKHCRRGSQNRVPILRNFIRYLPFIKMHPDIIHFDFPMTATTYSYLSEMLGVPTVVSCRGADIHMAEQRAAQNREGRIRSVREASVVHCVSNEMASEVQRLTGRVQGVWVNRPAVDIQKILPKQNYVSQGTPLIMAVGRLTWKKGFDYLLVALARLKRNHIAFRAQIVGAGELYSALRFSISDLDLADEVELIGSLSFDKVLRCLQIADIFVLSSHEEGISNALLEAMASGLPIVTTNAGGMVEVVRDDIEGFIVPVRDIRAMTDRIQRLLADGNLRQRMGRAARARIEFEFTLQRQAQIFEQMYESVIDLNST